MSARLIRRAALLAVVLLGAAPPGAADAIYGPTAGGLGADIVSVDNAANEQGDNPTTDAAISANGRYVVFQTQATNFFADDGVAGGDPDPAGVERQGGIYRYDRVTGQLALVADGSQISDITGALLVQGAQNPSVSADGRYVAFSTAQPLEPQDTNDNIDVYVRDMDVPLTADRQASGAFTLVSALNGSSTPASYAPFNPPVPGGNPGADVWPNISISGDGRYVLFRSDELASNLPGGGGVNTQPGQLFVRDLVTGTTTLVTAADGANGTLSGAPEGGAEGPASISADGSTVAWVGHNAPEQTRFLPGESLDDTPDYYLWRRWSTPGAGTRRITGIADPDDASCPPGGSVTADATASGPCYGPLTFPEAALASIAAAAPGLSADGNTVAFLASGALRPDDIKPDTLDAFITSMAPGATRKDSTRQLTLAATAPLGAINPVTSLALSEDGSTLAFTSAREVFVLPEPAPVGTFRSTSEATDLYIVDLRDNTLSRAVLGVDGSDPNGSVLATPTLTADGSTVAFASNSSNLIFGDANGVNDAFTATLQTPTGTAAPTKLLTTPSSGFSLSGVASPSLGISVKRGRKGSLLVLVEVPGAGRTVAVASGRLPTSKPAAKRAAGKPKAKGATAQRAAKPEPKPVILAQAASTTGSEGTTTLTLNVTAKYRAALAKAKRLGAAISVRFTPSSVAVGLGPLTGTVTSTFTAPPASAKKPPAKRQK